jgi:hypothetical protein
MIADPFQRRMVVPPSMWDLLESYGDAAHGPSPFPLPAAGPPEVGLVLALRAEDARRFPGALPAEVELLRSYGPGVAAIPPAGWPVVVETVDPRTLLPETTADQVVRYGWGAASLVSMVLGVIHGYRRNHGSVAWAAAWGAMGSAFPVFTPALAYVQGFGIPSKGGR